MSQALFHAENIETLKYTKMDVFQISTGIKKHHQNGLYVILGLMKLDNGGKHEFLCHC